MKQVRGQELMDFDFASSSLRYFDPLAQHLEH